MKIANVVIVWMFLSCKDDDDDDGEHDYHGDNGSKARRYVRTRTLLNFSLNNTFQFPYANLRGCLAFSALRFFQHYSAGQNVHLA